jgi:hypothetical protein
MMEQFTDQIGRLIAEQIPSFRFEKAEGRLFRATDNGWQAIAFEVLPTGSQGIGKLAAHAQVRHEHIESLYVPYHLFLKPKEAKSHPTLVANCDSLLKNKNLAHGFSLDPLSVDTFAAAYADAIRSDVIPWLDKFSDEQSLFAGLAERDPKHWPTSNRLIRFPVLMAILASRGDVVGFDAVGAEFQDWCKQKHALVYAPLAAAMLNMRPTPDSELQAPRG